MILPNTDRRAMDHFLPAINNTATDELQAHTGMFAAHSNDGYYKLGLEAAGIIREAVMLSRGVLQPETQIDPQLEKEAKKAAEMEKEQVVEIKTEERESTAAYNSQSASAT